MGLKLPGFSGEPNEEEFFSDEEISSDGTYFSHIFSTDDTEGVSDSERSLLVFSSDEEDDNSYNLGSNPNHDRVFQKFDGADLLMDVALKLPQDFKACILNIFKTKQGDPALNMHKTTFKAHISFVMGAFKETIRTQMNEEFTKQFPQSSDKERALFASLISVQLLLQGNHLEEIIKNTLDATTPRDLEAISQIPFQIGVKCHEGIVTASVRDFGKGFPPSYLSENSTLEHSYIEIKERQGKNSEKKNINGFGTLGGAGRGLILAAGQADNFNKGIVTVSNHKHGGAMVSITIPANPTINYDSELGARHQHKNQILLGHLNDAKMAVFESMNIPVNTNDTAIVDGPETPKTLPQFFMKSRLQGNNKTEGEAQCTQLKFSW